MHAALSDTLHQRLQEHSKCFDTLLSLLPAKYYFTPKIDEKNYGKPVAVSELKLQRLQRLDPKNAASVPELIAKDADKPADDESSAASGSDSEDSAHEVDSRPGKKQKQANSQASEVATDFQFSKVVTGSELLAPGKKQNKHQLLKRAEEKKRKFDEVKGTTKAVELQEKQAWTNALKRAAGEKVKDDPALLRKSLQNERRKKHKSAKQWAERIEEQQSKKQEQQQRREEHLRKRAEARHSGKKPKQKHQQKQRPGFEGKKTGFLNSKSGKQGGK